MYLNSPLSAKINNLTTVLITEAIEAYLIEQIGTVEQIVVRFRDIQTIFVWTSGSDLHLVKRNSMTQEI